MRDCEWDAQTCIVAASNGHLHVLKWAIANGCECDYAEICKGAASNGHLHVLKWVTANAFEYDYAQICEAAASHGQLHVLKWAVNGCDYAEDFRAAPSNEQPFVLMSGENDLEVI